MAVEPEVLSTLSDLFRSHGYEGASLSKISDATGLVKASLYHRFPGGKEEMADRVLDEVAREFSTHVLAPIYEDGDLKEAGRRIQVFYDKGKLACLLDTLTLNSDDQPIRKHAAQCMEYWIASFEKSARDAGWKNLEARRRAEDAVAAIEGALILARVSGNRQPFQRAIESLPARLGV